MNFIDRFLNSITMYRLVLAGLSVLSVVAIILGFTGTIHLGGLSLIVSLAVILASCYFSNYLFAKIYKASCNVESAWISGFILFFILDPNISVKGILLLVGASVLAMLSKYVLAIKKRHIFNPVAIIAVIFGLLGSGVVIWWVASPVLNIFSLIIGLLIVRKIRRFRMFATFLLTSIVVAIFTYVIPSDIPLAEFGKELLLTWQLIFFGLIMFTEPLTSPVTLKTQFVYAVIVGAIFSSQLQFGSLYATPEIALVLGNIYAFIVSSKQRLSLEFVLKDRLTDKVYDFAFKSNQKLKFLPGQYLEWTLPHEKPDTRGNRRFFTIASSPTEDNIHLGVRIDPEQSSSFKKKLFSFTQAERITATHLSGEFTMPKDVRKKLVFIAGGVGITPFRSMTKYMADVGEKRDVVLFYQAANESDFAYNFLFDEVKSQIGMRCEYIATNPTEEWQGRKGYVTEALVREVVPDFAERIFYISGPNAMVQNYKKLLRGMGVQQKNIKTDYFPGY